MYIQQLQYSSYIVSQKGSRLDGPSVWASHDCIQTLGTEYDGSFILNRVAHTDSPGYGKKVFVFCNIWPMERTRNVLHDDKQWEANNEVESFYKFNISIYRDIYQQLDFIETWVRPFWHTVQIIHVSTEVAKFKHPRPPTQTPHRPANVPNPPNPPTDTKHRKKSKSIQEHKTRHQ